MNILTLRPGHHRRQGHQDRLDIAAGLQAEDGAAIVEQVELDIAAAAHQLMLAVLLGPAFLHVAPDERRIDVEEGQSDVARKGEIALPIAAVEIIVEDAADAARLAAMLQEEIFVAPLLEARVIAGIVRVAGLLEARVEIARVRLDRPHRREVGAAAEPALRCGDEARVHVRGRYLGRAGMHDERDAARPEARILLRTRDLLAEFLGEGAVHGRDVDAGLLQHAAVQDRHLAAAALGTAFLGALPRLALEATGRPAGERAARELGLDRLEGGAQSVAQGREPGRGGGAMLGEQIGARAGCGGGHGSNPSVWRKASPRTMPAATATLIERKPGCIGMRMRASALSATSGGTPPVSRPIMILSLA